MAPIRYSLHYEDYSEHLMSRFGKLLQTQSLVDMTLMCSSHTLRVHKAVLAASSAYFQEVLQKQSGEIPVFTPPVVINRPPQSLIDLHPQDVENKNSPSSLLTPVPSTTPAVDNLTRTNKDMVVRIPFDIENSGTSSVDYSDTPRTIKPRRGRPSIRRPGAWEGGSSLGRAAERALMRREQDSRKAIHHLKHLQTRHMQDYMDRVSLSQAVDSICGPESSNSYMNINNDLMYMDQTVSSNVLDSTIPYNKDHPLGNETITSYANTIPTSSNNETSTSGINTAMSQYVNALKNAGLPTDLPILFESGDGSYINVNEQVLLDMVQSSEIQYEVIEQPNIIEKVADPSEIKSIDDLSKSIERGEILLGSKSYGNSDYEKNTSQYNRTEDAINSLNAILPDNLESFGEQQNYVVLDPRLQDSNNSMDSVNSHDFSCMDGDMQFFTKSISDDVKKFYEDQQLNDSRVMEQLCPVSNTLDTNFSMSLLDTKCSNLGQQYNPLNPEDLRRNDDCYDFGLQLPQSAVFKEDALDCLMATPKRDGDEHNNFDDASHIDQRVQERDEIIKDLMNIENKMNMAQKHDSSIHNQLDTNTNSNLNSISNIFETDTDKIKELNTKINDVDLSATIAPSALQWDNLDVEKKDSNEQENNDCNKNTSKENDLDHVIDLTDSMNVEPDENWVDIVNENHGLNKNNDQLSPNEMNSDLQNDIPFAVGLLPLKQMQSTEEGNLLKRKISVDNYLENADAKCLKRKAKYKNV